MKQKIDTPINVGIDTSLSQLHIYIRPLDECFSVSNDTPGIQEAIRRIKSLKPTRVLIEATGRLEMAFVCRVHQARLPIVVCNAAQVRQFAKATGRLAKTDRLDAQNIAHFGEALQPNLTPLKPEKPCQISDLLAVRSQLLDMSTMQKNRLQRMPHAVHAPIRRVLKSIQKEIAALDASLDSLLQQVPKWKHKKDLLLSAKGVGNVLAYTLMSELPELGQLNRKETAALVGLAPINNDSGSYKGKRPVRGGRHKVRTVLFMSIMSAIQCHPTLKPTFQRLVTSGKSKKVAIVACMRKQLTILNAMVRNNTPWYAQHA